MTNKTISVVMPIYIMDQVLVQKTREALYSVADEYNELVIVDDASPLPTKEFEMIADVYIRNKTNRGYIQSANRGFDTCTSDYIILMCNDTKKISGTLSDMLIDGYMFPRIEDKADPFWDGAFYCFPRVLGGKYDERYTNYFGDLDKFYDAKMRGVVLKQIDTVEVFHEQSQTTERVGIRQTDYEQGKQRFIDKWNIDPLENYYTLI